MSTSPLDFQLSLRQLSEGVRRQSKTQKHFSDDTTSKISQHNQALTTQDVEKVSNKEQELPLDEQTPVEKTNANAHSELKNPNPTTPPPLRIKETYKGNFLDTLD